MADLTYLNEAAVLHNLRQRYYAQLIYVSFLQRILYAFLFLPTGEKLQEGAGVPGESTQI